MFFINKLPKRINPNRVERWIGKEQASSFRTLATKWYGTPIPLGSIPGDVRVCADGDFVGKINGGQEACIEQWLHDRRVKEYGFYARRQGGGFTGLSNLRRQRENTMQQLHFSRSRGSVTANSTYDGWFIGGQPAVGANAGAAPGGTAFTKSTTGAMQFKNADSGKKNYYISGAGYHNIGLANYIIYDRIFGVTKTMNSTATEAVTGVPTRYQSTTQGAEDSAENNFLFILCRVVLPATAHNWTTCTYTDQSGNAGATLPSVTGISACAAGRLDMPINTWFAPLAAGDTGIKALTQMQCSALVATGNIDFVIGHMIGIVPVITGQTWHAFNGVNSAMTFSRIFDDACISSLEACIPSGGSGSVQYIVNEIVSD